MDILFKRGQSGRLGKTIFNLWAQVEFTEEENALIDKYKMKTSMLIYQSQPKLIIHTVLFGLACGILMLVLSELFNYVVFAIAPFLGGPNFLSVLALLGGAFAFYSYNRQTIYVSDLMTGRHFKCISVVDLVKQEAMLNDVCMKLRQVLESAKHWDDAERLTVPVLSKDEAKEFVLKHV